MTNTNSFKNKKNVLYLILICLLSINTHLAQDANTFTQDKFSTEVSPSELIEQLSSVKVVAPTTATPATSVAAAPTQAPAPKATITGTTSAPTISSTNDPKVSINASTSAPASTTTPTISTVTSTTATPDKTTTTTTTTSTNTKITSNVVAVDPEPAKSTTTTVTTSVISAKVTGGKKCFLGSVDNNIEDLNKRIENYTIDLLKKGDADYIKKIVNLSKFLADSELKLRLGKWTDADMTALKARSNELEGLKLINSVSDINFSNLSNELKEMAARDSEAKRYSTYYINDIKRLIFYIRSTSFIQSDYKDRSQCLPFNKSDMTIIKEVARDPKNNATHLACVPQESETFTVDPEDFEEEGIGIVYFTKEDTSGLNCTNNNTFFYNYGPNIQIPSNAIKVNEGFLNNKKIFDLLYTCEKNHTIIVNYLVIGEELVVLRTPVTSPEYIFVFISIQKYMGKYTFTTTIRFSCSDQVQTVTREVTRELIEKLIFNFRRPGTLNGPFIYKNFIYSEVMEQEILYDTVTRIFTNQKISEMCPTEPNCIFRGDDNCKNCKEGMFLSNGKCVEKCPNGNYPKMEDGKCEPCHATCAECTATDCQVCKEPNFLVKTPEGKKCLPTCPIGQAILDKECKECPDNCQNCLKPDECNTCKADFYKQQGGCISTCPEGFFKSRDPNECKSCLTGCAACQSLGKCDKCQTGYYLKDGVCIKDCGTGYFADLTSGKCESCVQHCKECSDVLSCKVCNDGFLLDMETKFCKNKCSLGQISYQNTCLPCGDKVNCLECQNTNIQICKKCNEKTILKNGKCVTDCGNGFFVNEQNECKECGNLCQACNKDRCVICETGNYLLENKVCTPNCPDGYTISGNTCIKCTNNNCKRCSEKTLDVCTECYLPKFLKEGNCVENCGDHYYPSGSTCNKCENLCQKCQNGSICNECEPGLLFKGNHCVKECGPGMTAENGKCFSCTVNNCNKCSKDKNTCEECQSPYLLYANFCHNVCPIATFQKPDRTCENCSKDCNSCTDKATCNECNSPKVLQNNECREKCDDKFVAINKKCQECKNKNCNSCDVSSLSNCLTCPTNSYLWQCVDTCPPVVPGNITISGNASNQSADTLLELDSKATQNLPKDCIKCTYQKDCVTTCPTGTVAQGTECLKCNHPCQTCTKDPSTCEKCVEGFAMDKTGKCTDNCGPGTSKNTTTRTCQECLDKGCDKCNVVDLTECIKCSSTMKLLRGDCFEKCPDGFFPDANGSCQPCIQGCKLCPNSNSCEKCNEPLLLKGKNSCVTSCLEGYIPLDGNCVQCKSNCVKCNPSDLSYCTVCPSGLLLLDGKCQVDCPDRFWPNNDKCSPCDVKECSKCSSQGKICEKCTTQFVLNDNECINRPCTSGKVEINDRCKNCEVPNCDKCLADNTKVCTDCKKPLYLIDKFNCGNNCNLGYYGNSETQKCEKCTDNCNKCQNPNICQGCASGFYLQDGVCVNQCKDGYRVEGNTCIKCNPENCKKCTEKQCITCNPPLVLHLNTCVQVCPNGFYPDNQNALMSATCKECSSNCLKCTSQDCDECKAPFILSTDRKCTDKCPNGSVEVKNEKKCINCLTDPKKCLKCDASNLEKCTTCTDGLFLLGGECLIVCPEGYFSQDGVCKKCLDNCKICKDDKTCEECKTPYVLDEKLCKPTCPSGKYPESGRCESCKDPQCENCDKKGCKKCGQGLVKSLSGCSRVCSPKSYLNLDTCEECSEFCLKCQNAQQCTECEAGYSVFNGKCVEFCDPGYVSIDGNCVPCEKGCKVCDNLNAQKCLECKDNLFLQNEKCVDVCKAGFFGAITPLRKCENCLLNCDVCKDNKNCDLCKKDYFYQHNMNVCGTKCEEGFKSDPDTRKCIPCEVSGCSQCVASTKICEKCKSEFFKLDNTCYNACPAEKYYTNIQSKTCEKCPSECKVCESPEKCKKCEDGFLLQNQKCVNKCEAREVEVNKECKPCVANDCLQCMPADPSTCAICNRVKIVTIEKGIKVTKCGTECTRGTFEKNKECQNCVKNCDVCINDKTCQECSFGYLLEEGQCVNICRIGYVERQGKCLPCDDKNCNVCDNLNLGTCKKCNLPYLLKNGKCVEKCDSGFYEFILSTDNKVCNTCIDKCQKCSNDDNCIECQPGTYLKKGKCEIDCGENWVNVNEKECKRCTQPECIKCSKANVDLCVECKNPFFMTDKSLCVPTCGNKYFERTNPSRACISCTDKNCITCSPENMCNLCESPYVVLNNQCTTACPDGYFVGNSRICNTCNEKSCKECSPENSNICKTCPDGKFLHENKCVNVCPIKFFPSQGKCVPCSPICSECHNAESCDKCLAPYSLTEDFNCVDVCKEGTVKVEGQCKKCNQKDCNKCDATNLDTCLECGNNQVLYNQKCIEKCPTATYNTGKECKECNCNCEICSDDLSCNKCKSPYILQNNECVVKCLNGYTEIDGKCVDCQDKDKCNVCEKNLKTCTECRQPLVLSEGTCLENCKPTYFFSEEKKQCVKCIENCEKCDNTNTCTKCLQPFKLNQKGVCVEKCEDRYYETPDKCKPCENSNCIKCDAMNPKNCNVCPNGHLIIQTTANTIDCIDNCPKGWFKTDDKKCSKCDAKCGECKEEKNCINCVTPFVLNGTECLNLCPEGMVNRNGSCYKCSDSDCSVCDVADLNKCLKCKSKILFNDNCIEKCPQKYAYDAQTKTCKTCAKNCNECTADTCQKCDTGYIFMENTKNCVVCEKPLLVKNGECATCKVSGCLECVTEKDDTCRVCDSKLVLIEGKCRTECPETYFQQTNTCQKCGPNCLKCDSNEKCLKCKGEMVVLSGNCVEKCPDGFSKNGDECHACVPENCIECKDSVKICNKCKNKLIAFNGNCIEFCPAGFFLKIDKCDKCSANCKTCNDKGCTECDAGFKIKGSDCVNNCGKGFYENGKLCESCIEQNCEECTPANNCTKCREDFFIIKEISKCTTSCPDGTYANKTTKECTKCDQGCKRCTENTCIECSNGFFMNEGKCVNVCPDKKTILNGRCEKCLQPDCINCLPEYPEKCIKCPPTNPRYKLNCETKCPTGTFQRVDECISCDNKCDDCSNEKTCLKCKTQFILDNGSCVNVCPDGKVANMGQCISCIDRCDYCTQDGTKCLKCTPPYKTHNLQCKEECPDGFFADPVTNDCKECRLGCLICKGEKTCLKCKNGFFMKNGECVTNCGLGLFGDCKEHLCKNCNSLCDECGEATSQDCVRCASNAFRSIDSCVHAEDCRVGTYPDTTNRTCSACNIAFCERCKDKNTCIMCVKGRKLEGDKCVNGNTFASIFEKPTLVTTNTYADLTTKISKLNYIAVSVPHVTFSFWLRLLAPVRANGDSVIFSVKNAPGFDYTLTIDSKTNKCKFTVNFRENKAITEVRGIDCSYEKLFDWKLFTINIAKELENGISIKLFSGNPEDELSSVTGSFKNTINVQDLIQREATFVFGNDPAAVNSNPALFELSDFNIYDYIVSVDDIIKMKSILPSSCDIFCSTCKNGTCSSCINGTPLKNGKCPPQSVPIINGLGLINNNVNTITFKSTNIFPKLVTDSWGVSLWFYIQTDDDKTISLFELNYIYPDKKVNSLTVTLDKLSVNVNGNDLTVKVKKNEWVYLSLNVSRKLISTEILYQDKVTRFTNEFNFPTFIERLFYDYEVNVGGNNWSGSYYNFYLFENNTPLGTDIEKQQSSLSVPLNCLLVSREITCTKCIDNYILRDDGKCIDGAFSNLFTLVQRVDLFKDETYSYQLPPNDKKSLGLSLWLRKKTHSFVTDKPTNSILSLIDDQDKKITLITQTILPNYTSRFDIKINDTKEGTLSYDYQYANRIFDYIHVALSFELGSSSMTCTIKDIQSGKELTKTDKFEMKKFQKLIIGGDSIEQANIEVSLLELYFTSLSKETIEKIRKENKPIDCNSACRDNCDLRSGFCNSCFDRKPNKECGTALLGFSYVYLYNMKLENIPNKGAYLNPLSSENYSVGVNSVQYSIFANIRLYDFKSLNDKNKYTIVTLGNSMYTDPKVGSMILGLNVKLVNNRPTFVWNVNAEGTIVEENITQFEVLANKWYSIHAGIDVVNKTFQYIIFDRSANLKYRGNKSLPTYPEKLQQHSIIRLFGINEGESNSILPNAISHSCYFSINVGFSEPTFDKFLSRYTIDVDPVCPENCDLCTINNKKTLICLKCKDTFFFKNNVECIPPLEIKSSYLSLIDKPITEGSLDVSSVRKLINYEESYSVGFFFRGSTLPLGTTEHTLLSGALNAKIIYNSDPNIVLEIASINLSVPVKNLYTWNLVVLNYIKEKNQILATVYNESNPTEIVDRQYRENKIFLDHTQNLILGNRNYQLYGINFVNRYLSNSLIDWPRFDCSRSCLFCSNNQCKACLYGLENGACNNPKYKFDLNGSTGYNAFTFSEKLGLGQFFNLRTSKLTVQFRLSNLGVYKNILSFKNGNDVLFELNYNLSNKSYQIIERNRIAPLKFWDIEYSLEKLDNKENYVALTFDGETLNYLFYNSNHYFKRGTIKIGGLIFHSYITPFFPSDGAKDPEFKFDEATSSSDLLKDAQDIVEMIQNACLKGDWKSCTSCASPAVLNNSGFCGSTKNTQYALANRIISLSRTNLLKDPIKLNLQNDSLSSFSFSFWWKLEGSLSTRQGIASLQISDGSKGTNILNIVFTPKNQLEVTLTWGEQKQTISINNIYEGKETFIWKHFAFSFDSKTKKLIIYVNCSLTNKTISRELVLPAATPAIPSAKKMILPVFGFSDKLLLVDDNISFSVFGLMFDENIAINDAIENLRLNDPRECNLCKGDCTFGICNASSQVEKAISVGNILQDTKIDTYDDIIIESKNLYLLRTLIDSDAYHIQSFSTYLVSIDIDVSSYLSSKYVVNKDILLCITNQNKQEFEELRLSDLLPSDIYRSASLSITYDNGNLVLYRGYLPWSGTVNGSLVPLGGKLLKDYSKVFIAIQCDKFGTRIVVSADDVIFAENLQNLANSESINPKSLIYNHPSIVNVRLNVRNPLIDVEFRENILQNIPSSANNTRNFCAKLDKNCDRCVDMDNSITAYCTSCVPGFNYFLSECLPSLNQIPNTDLLKKEMSDNMNEKK